MDRKRNLARRRDRWNPWEENLLIKIWAEKIGSLRGSKKNYYVYQDIARTLQGHGLRATPEKVRSKLRNLTRRYRLEIHILFAETFYDILYSPELPIGRKEYMLVPLENQHQNGLFFRQFTAF